MLCLTRNLSLTRPRVANSDKRSAHSSQPSIVPHTSLFMNLQHNSFGLMSRDLKRKPLGGSVKILLCAVVDHKRDTWP